MSDTFKRERPHIPCADVWPPGSYQTNELLAYGVLERRGAIIVEKVEVGKRTGKIVVRYLSTVPIDWIHAELRRACDDLNNGRME